VVRDGYVGQEMRAVGGRLRASFCRALRLEQIVPYENGVVLRHRVWRFSFIRLGIVVVFGVGRHAVAVGAHPGHRGQIVIPVCPLHPFVTLDCAEGWKQSRHKGGVCLQSLECCGNNVLMRLRRIERSPRESCRGQECEEYNCYQTLPVDTHELSPP